MICSSPADYNSKRCNYEQLQLIICNECMRCDSDYSTHVLCSIKGRYESSKSKHSVINSNQIYCPFSIRDILYFTDRQTGIISVSKTGGSVH